MHSSGREGRERIAKFVRVKPGLVRDLEEILRRENRTYTDWLHEAMEAYIKAHGAGNPSVPLDKFLADPKYVAVPTVLEMDKFKDQWQQLDQVTQRDIRAKMTRALNILDELIPPTPPKDRDLFKAIDEKIRKKSPQ